MYCTFIVLPTIRYQLTDLLLLLLHHTLLLLPQCAVNTPRSASWQSNVASDRHTQQRFICLRLPFNLSLPLFILLCADCYYHLSGS